MVILGKDGKEYRNVKDCLAADDAFDKRVAEEAAKKEALKKAEDEKIALKKAEISRRKKELSSNIEKADEELKLARLEYKQAKEKAEKIIEDAYKEAQAITNEAHDFLKNAASNKSKAISTFNKEFGPFTTVITSEEAWDEIQNGVEETLKRIFRWF